MSGPGRHCLPLQTSQMQWKALAKRLASTGLKGKCCFLKRVEKWSLDFHNDAQWKLGLHFWSINVWSKTAVAVNTYREDAQANTYVNAFGSKHSVDHGVHTTLTIALLCIFDNHILGSCVSFKDLLMSLTAIVITHATKMHFHSNTSRGWNVW